MFFPYVQFSHFTSAKTYFWKRGSKQSFDPCKRQTSPPDVVLCSAVVPEAYFLNYNTKRDYRTEVKSGSRTGPNKDGKLYAPQYQSCDCGIWRDKSVHYRCELLDRLQKCEQSCCDAATATFGIFVIEFGRKSNDCGSIWNRRGTLKAVFLLKRQDGFKLV